MIVWAYHHLGAAREAVARGHNLAAIRHLHSCRYFSPDDPEVLLLCARVARRGGSWGEADALLDRYWQLRGDEEALVQERLLLRATKGELEGVRSLLQARIDEDGPAAPLAREALIAGLLQRYYLNEAKEKIDRWLAHEPDSTLALLSLGKLQETRDQTTSGLLTYRRILEIDPEHDDARLRLTTILVRLSQGEVALAHLEHLRRRFPDHAEVRVQYAQALELQGRVDEARAVLDQMLRDHPEHAAALAERGRIARLDGDEPLAEDYLRRAVALDPGNYAARFQYSLTLNQNGKKEEAAKEKEAIRQMEADIASITQIVNGRLQETPDDPALYYEAGAIVLRAGRPKEALRWWLNALQVDPNHAPTHRALAGYYQTTGNPILAARHRAIAKQLSSQSQP
jgi:tetratricopeptide (TPR) repeat protein